jgi:hypothetical protein
VAILESKVCSVLQDPTFWKLLLIIVAMSEGRDNWMESLGDIRESLALAESLASASLLTSPGAKRRLAARRLELGEDPSTGVYTPPKHLLLYLVR